MPTVLFAISLTFRVCALSSCLVLIGDPSGTSPTSKVEAFFSSSVGVILIHGGRLMGGSSVLHYGHIVLTTAVVKLISQLDRKSAPVRREKSGVTLNRWYCLKGSMDDLLTDNIFLKADTFSITGGGFPRPAHRARVHMYMTESTIASCPLSPNRP